MYRSPKLNDIPSSEWGADFAKQFGWTNSASSRGDPARANVEWGEVLGARLGRLQGLAQERGLDALFVASPGNVIFCTNWPRYRPSVHEGAYAALVSFAPQRVILFASEGDAALVREDASFEDIRILPPWKGAWSPVLRSGLESATLQNGVIGGDGPACAALMALARESSWLTMEIRPADDVLSHARMVKSSAEIAAYLETIKVVEQGINLAIERLTTSTRPVTEMEVAAEANYTLLLRGCTQADIWCTSGTRTAPLRRYPSHQPIRREEFALVDGGGIRDGYRSEFARTVWTGGTPSGMHIALYRAVYDALEAGQAAVRAGAWGSAVEQACLEPIREAGLEDYYGGYPFTGHGIGIGSEAPYITSRFQELDCELKAGMLLNLEPGLWMDGVGGVRLENTMLVTEDAPVILSRAPFDDRLLDAKKR